ncbi:MAG: molybdate ABC transporter substrate-binding protein [Pirellulales bacterium]
MKARFAVVVLASVAVVAGAAFLLRRPSPHDDGPETIVLFYAAGVRAPVRETIEDYQREFPNVRVEVMPSGSGQLLTQVLAGQKGDLFLAADSSYVDRAYEKGAVAERLDVAVQWPVLSIRKDSSLDITDVRSLLGKSPTGEGLKIGLGNPEGPAIGKASKAILERAGIWKQVKSAVESRGVFKPTVQELANDIKLGTIDVAILVDGTAAQYPELKVIPIAKEINEPLHISIGVMTTTENPSRALHFARYLTARDRGLKNFARYDYDVIDGDAWADVPALKLMSGNILMPVISETLAEFEKREGVEIVRNFNGCGALTTSLKAGGETDAYFACDISFMSQVSDLFLDPVNVSQTRMVIAVPKGNPKGIQKLADLAQAGVKVGVANAKQSALGALTEQLLARHNLLDTVKKNIVTQVPTADMLVVQLQGPSGGESLLDAVVVYEVNALRGGDNVEIVPIAEADSPAVQPYAVARQSKHAHLAERLLDAIRQTTSRKRFEHDGFVWLEGGKGK